ncbi:MAG TPA: pantoate--beta-alanine ligase [Kiritimatiellia bacterium]|nr:pantoate--beta-alanine ligase [Kiritimatiellia bacterium]
MITIQSTGEMQAWALTVKRQGRSIALVPTMGYLHEGHLSLIDIARTCADQVVVSIFVNPAQFGPNEDFDRYPRDIERDSALCAERGVDVVFFPPTREMYLQDHSVYVIEEKLGGGLCGAARPGHFRGVTTVVAKLFNVILPDAAVFGEKDAQQLRIIRRMVRDLNFPVSIVSAPTAREADGLAMSSRNIRLTPEDRKRAPLLFAALNSAAKAFYDGERKANRLLAMAEERIRAASPTKIDYVELVDDESLEPITGTIDRDALLALAVWLSDTRLIDNISLKV